MALVGLLGHSMDTGHSGAKGTRASGHSVAGALGGSIPLSELTIWQRYGQKCEDSLNLDLTFLDAASECPCDRVPLRLSALRPCAPAPKGLLPPSAQWPIIECPSNPTSAIFEGAINIVGCYVPN